MALQWKWTEKMGKMTIRQKRGEFTLNIYNGNALAIFVSEYTDKDGDEAYILYNFFADKKYCDNIIKSEKTVVY